MQQSNPEHARNPAQHPATDQSPEPPTRLGHFPISFFAVVMGMSGLTLVWQKAAVMWPVPATIGQGLLVLTAGLFLVIAILYIAKLLRYRRAVVAELRHPIKLSFFPAVSISLILLGTCSLHVLPDISLLLWAVGSTVHLLFTLYVLQTWMHQVYFEIHHINPAWFIPMVGNILVPVAGVEHGYLEISLFFFTIGLLFWLVLLTLFFNRMIFHQPLPAKLLPTLFILIAPPAIGFIAYTKLTGETDLFAHILYYAALFFTLLLLIQLQRFRRLQFFLSWWAYSFPMAAISLATMRHYETTGISLFGVLSYVLVTLTTLLILYLLYRTLHAILGNEICVEEA